MTPEADVRRRRSSAGALALVVIAICAGGPAGAAPREDAPLVDRAWTWPVDPFRLMRPYEAPAHEYGPGHRGVDLLPLGTDLVSSPAAGVVAFAGDVAGRGILTIDHGDGLVTTLEPVRSPLSPGSSVAQGDVVGSVSVGGHADRGTVHFGVRLHGEYINPMLLLGGVPHAVLLPCC